MVRKVKYLHRSYRVNLPKEVVNALKLNEEDEISYTIKKNGTVVIERAVKGGKDV